MKTKTLSFITLIIVLSFLIGCQKTTYLDRPLRGTLRNTEYTFNAAYAVDAWIFPDESWTVLIYPEPVTVDSKTLDYRFDRIHKPSLSVTIEKDPGKNQYIFNSLGIPFRGNTGTILTGIKSSNEKDDVNFSKGYMEILDRDLETGILYAKLWAKTDTGSGFISGNIKIEIME